MIIAFPKTNPMGETRKKQKSLVQRVALFNHDQGNMLLLRVGTQNLGKAEWLYLDPTSIMDQPLPGHIQIQKQKESNI